MIGTIAFTTTLANQKHHQNRQSQQQQQQLNGHQNHPQLQPNLVRSPSVLQRLRSMNFYTFRSQEPTPHLAAHFKSTPDLDAHDQIQQLQSFETHSQYLFAQPHQEKQAVYYGNHQEITQQAHYFPQQIIYQEKPQENQSQYFFEQTNEEKHQQTQAHYFPQQIYNEKPQENQTQYFCEQANEEKHQENETPSIFQQSHEENAHKEESHFDSEQAHEEKGQENEYHFDSDQPHEDYFENDELQSLDQVYSQLTQRHDGGSKSDTKPAAGEIPSSLPAKMKKSASMKSPFKHFEEEDIVETRRPATVKERKARVTEADEGVDAKADDFINRFKQQLKLQRLDSIIRRKEMIGRGTAGGTGR